MHRTDAAGTADSTWPRLPGLAPAFRHEAYAHAGKPGPRYRVLAAGNARSTMAQVDRPGHKQDTAAPAGLLTQQELRLVLKGRLQPRSQRAVVRLPLPRELVVHVGPRRCTLPAG